MAIFEWAREPGTFDGSSGLSVYELAIRHAEAFHGPAFTLDEQDVVTSALFPYVTPHSYLLDAGLSIARMHCRMQFDDFDTEQTAAYAKILDMATEEVASYQNLPAFMGSVLLK